MRDVLEGKKIYYKMPPYKKGWQRHHIIPKHMGGTDADGVVYLTQVEHAEAHWLLYCEHKNKADLASMNFIMERNVVDVSGENHHMWGKHHTEEAKEKIRKTKTGTKLSEAHKQKLRETHPRYWEGKERSSETKERIREAKIGVSNPTVSISNTKRKGIKYQEYDCNFCDKRMTYPLLVLWGHDIGQCGMPQKKEGKRKPNSYWKKRRASLYESRII